MMKVKSLLNLIAILLSLMMSQNLCANTDKLGHSGRLVQTNGMPVTGTVNLKFDLYYSNDLITIQSTQQINSVALANGVYTVELDFDNSGTFPGPY